MGHPKTDHDCRHNFNGTAKAMEPYAAVQLTKNNEILMENNTEIGIVIADNDSSAIAAIRNTQNHEIVKQSDKNHTSKELNTDAIKYLQKCFNYSISKNIGDCENMAKAIQNIPYHTFNIHENCGLWCHYNSMQEEYRHKIIGEGFKNLQLFDELKSLFCELANNAAKFSGGASSNPNESFNLTLVSKAPKSRVYGTSASCHTRAALATLHKNEGYSYLPQLNIKLNCSPGKNTYNYGRIRDQQKERRYATSKTVEFKKRRLFLKKRRLQLREKKSLLEGTTYETDSQLFKTCDVHLPIANFQSNEKVLVFFDLETNGLSMSAEILQIAAKSDNFEFCIYIKLNVQAISPEVSAITGLYFANGELILNGEVLITHTLFEAMVAFYEYLFQFKKKCILVGHNVKFDYTRLIVAINKVFMTNQYESIIEGFTDTLPIIKKVNKAKGKGQNKLENLALNLQINAQDAHNAKADVRILHEVLLKLQISDETLKEYVVTWKMIKDKKLFQEKLSGELKKLEMLKGCTSLATRKKLIAANITYEIMEETYNNHKNVGLYDLLTHVTKSSIVIRKINDYFYLKNM
ncbi:uncharacterized protein [Prorops nasuta]|uniref:uncharacterized protein n=1 Tax=Prorops nasuta TaxID=863751 RepID=UPI0034CED1BF